MEIFLHAFPNTPITTIRITMLKSFQILTQIADEPVKTTDGAPVFVSSNR